MVKLFFNIKDKQCQQRMFGHDLLEKLKTLDPEFQQNGLYFVRNDGYGAVYHIKGSTVAIYPHSLEGPVEIHGDLRKSIEVKLILEKVSGLKLLGIAEKNVKGLKDFPLGEEPSITMRKTPLPITLTTRGPDFSSLSYLTSQLTGSRMRER